MGYRIFRDSTGTEWQTWDVVPRLSERRTRERRMRTLPPPREERRRAVDRRVASGRRPLLSAGLDCGWLCFEAEVEKRRLSPIPTDWMNCATARLEEYCRSAKLARRPNPVDLRNLRSSGK
jgi:hypothetical protein